MKVLTETPDDIENVNDARIIGDIRVEIEPGDLKAFTAEQLVYALERYATFEEHSIGEPVYIGVIDYPFDADGRYKTAPCFIVAGSEDAERATIVSGRVPTGIGGADD